MSLIALIQSRASTQPVQLGLGHLTDAVDGVAIPNTDLPGFTHAGVSGDNPVLKIGTLERHPIAVYSQPPQSHQRQAATST